MWSFRLDNRIEKIELYKNFFYYEFAKNMFFITWYGYKLYVCLLSVKYKFQKKLLARKDVSIWHGCFFAGTLNVFAGSTKFLMKFTKYWTWRPADSYWRFILNADILQLCRFRELWIYLGYNFRNNNYKKFLYTRFI